MKKYIYAMVAALLILGCEDTNENLVQQRGVAVHPVMSDPSPAYFTDNLEASYIQFDLSLPQGETVDKVELEVVRGDKRAILREVTLPITGLQVTATEVIQALSIPVNDYNVGDIFDLIVLTTKNGKTYYTSATVRIPVVCYFDTDMLVGVFDYESDDWGEAGTITLVADPNDPYTVYLDGYPQSEGLTGNGNRISLTVNPDNFRVTGPATILADDLAEWGIPSYRNYTMEPVAGSYSACTNQYVISFFISCSAGNWGNNEFIFTKR